MTRITITSRVGADGMLHVDVPVGVADANREVQVTIEPTLVIKEKDKWTEVDDVYERLVASGRSFSDSAELLREDRER